MQRHYLHQRKIQNVTSANIGLKITMLWTIWSKTPVKAEVTFQMKTKSNE